MEIKTKYQYTYFIYPYIVNEKKMDKYLAKLLRNKNCELKIFEKEKDWDLYTYFLPKVRNYMLGSFEFGKNRVKKLEELDNSMKSVVLAKQPCTIFEYKIEKDIQGKAGRNDGIFFNIRKIEIVCFNTGICFLTIKTTLDEGSTIADVCNFNYKFRDINSTTNKLKDFENIKIQTDVFKDIKGISALIKDITGSNIQAKELNIDTERFITYSYLCIGQEDWNESSNEELLEKEFYKFANTEPSDYVVDANCSMEAYKIQKSKYVKYGCTKTSTVLLTSDINTENYTKLPHQYETQYLYNYIFELYKKIYLKKISKEFAITNKFSNTKEKFVNFTQSIWIEEATNDEIGNELYEQWKTNLSIDRTYAQVKQKYDIVYKNVNIEKTAKSNKWIAIILVILVIVNIINCINIIGK